MILGIGFNQLHANSADYEMSVDLGLGYRYCIFNSKYPEEKQLYQDLRRRKHINGT